VSDIKRLVFLTCLALLFSAGLGAGIWIGGIKHAAEVNELKQEILRLKTAPPKKFLTHDEALDDLPELDEATPNTLSMAEYRQQVKKRENERKVSLRSNESPSTTFWQPVSMARLAS